MDAESDERKRLANLAKHGIDFVDAAKIFDGPILEFPQGAAQLWQDRLATLGRVEDLIIYVICTWRGNRRRIISARKAGKNERERYHKSLI